MSKEEDKEFELRRRRGMRMLSRGVSQAEVAKALGVSRQTASRWARLLSSKSVAWRTGARGRPGGLADRQLRRLDALVRRRLPQEHGYAQHRWSTALVGELIEWEFGVRYSAVSVRRILKKLDLFPFYGWGCSRWIYDRAVAEFLRARSLDKQDIR